MSALSVQEFEGNFAFGGSWRDTYASTQRRAQGGQKAQRENTDANSLTEGGPQRKRKRKHACSSSHAERELIHSADACLRFDTVFSDVLYQPHLCATARLQPEWHAPDTLARPGHLSPLAFAAYELAGEPVVVPTGAPFARARRKWSLEYLGRALAGRHVTVGTLLSCIACI